MSVLVDLSIFPVGQGEHLSTYVAPVVQLISDSGSPDARLPRRQKIG